MHEAEGKLEVWGGVECTVNRVGDHYHDQLGRNGHLERPEDLKRFASLGLCTLRVPVLWELAEPSRGVDRLERFDAMLLQARALGLRVIAGLVHHGSGPRHTNLLDPDFEHGLADFAARVSERYPWIEDYTPVNEPLTTARFSALYGHWYPHARSAESFVRALLHETRGTIRAMQAIRARVPGARLVQTEDIGSVTSTPLLAYQAEHEDHRRWLSLDLLAGAVGPRHPLYRYLIEAGGVSTEELAWLERHACTPDLIGINYYFTSDRHLDERVQRYPAWAHGGNGHHAYADVDSTMAARALRGHGQVISEVWQRYQLPLALTEVHAGCTREEQMRWLDEAWQAAKCARSAGIDVRAVTAWSLLGSFDWNSLVTVEAGVYEPGVFDLRGPEPRPTALAAMVADLASRGEHAHPVLEGPGWWRRRLTEGRPALPRRKPSRPLAIVGPHGTLGRSFVEACRARGLPVELLDRARVDLTRPGEVRRALEEVRPWAVINAAGYVRVDDAEHDAERCLQVNGDGPLHLAQACQRIGSRLLTFSSDLVFDGAKRELYLERDSVAPLSVYGHSKVRAEAHALELLEGSLVVRTSAFFGPADQANFVTLTLLQLLRNEPVRAAWDVVISPTYVPHLTHACLELLIDGAEGIWHLANQGAVSWLQLAVQAARATGISERRLVPCRFAELGLAARRPVYSALGSERAALMPPLEEGLAHYAAQVASSLARQADLPRAGTARAR